jgi:hypothetical protein
MPPTNNSDPRLHGGHAAAEDAFLWFASGRWRMMWHQKIDDPTNHTGVHDQCVYFPYVGGYGYSETDDFDGRWHHDFFRPGFGLNASLANGSSVCFSRRERPKIALIEGRAWLTNGAMLDGIPGDGPNDRGTYTFIQEVLDMPPA